MLAVTASASAPSYGENPGARMPPPPPPPRPHSRTLSSVYSSMSSLAGTGSVRGSPSLSSAVSEIRSPRTYELDEVPGERTLIDINNRLIRLWQELLQYQGDIEKIQLGIGNNENYGKLRILDSQKIGLEKLINATREEYQKLIQEFDQGDISNGIAWTKSINWSPYIVYSETRKKVDDLLLQMQLPEMPKWYQTQVENEQLKSENAQLRQSQQLPPPKQACCIIL